MKLKPVFEEKAKANVSRVISQNNTERENPDFQISDKVEYVPVNTAKELAKVAGVSHDTIAKVQKIEEKAPEAVKEVLRSNIQRHGKIVHRYGPILITFLWVKHPSCYPSNG